MSIFDAALKVYASYDYPAEREAAGQDWDLFRKGYDEERLGKQDEAFYAVSPTMSERLGDYIKQHPDLFVE